MVQEYPHHGFDAETGSPTVLTNTSIPEGEQCSERELLQHNIRGDSAKHLTLKHESLEQKGFSRPSAGSASPANHTLQTNTNRRSSRMPPIRPAPSSFSDRYTEESSAVPSLAITDAEVSDFNSVPHCTLREPTNHQPRETTFDRFVVQPTCSSGGKEKSEGRLSDKYEELKVLGSGAFSIVRKVRNRNTGECFAAKSITVVSDSWYQRGEVQVKNGQLSTCRTMSEVQKECKLMYNLKKVSAVVNVADTIIEPSRITIVMELLRGGAVADFVDKAPDGLPEKQLKPIFFHLILAMQQLHAHHVIHRDMKLENVMLNDTKDPSTLKIIDFGLAVECENGSNRHVDSNFKGTLQCIAPEVALQQPPHVIYEAPCDMWAVGICLLMALTGTRCPFVSDGHETPPWWDKGKKKQKAWQGAISSAKSASTPATPTTVSPMASCPASSPPMTPKTPVTPKTPPASDHSVLVMGPVVQKEIQAYVTKKVDHWLSRSRNKPSSELSSFIRKLTQVNPAARITAAAALKDPWLLSLAASTPSPSRGVSNKSSPAAMAASSESWVQKNWWATPVAMASSSRDTSTSAATTASTVSPSEGGNLNDGVSSITNVDSQGCGMGALCRRLFGESKSQSGALSDHH